MPATNALKYSTGFGNEKDYFMFDSVHSGKVLVYKSRDLGLKHATGGQRLWKSWQNDQWINFLNDLPTIVN